MQQRESGKRDSFRELVILTDFLHPCEYMKTSNCSNVEGDNEKWDPWKILKGWRVAICMKVEGKKDIVQRQQIKQENCMKKAGSTGFSKLIVVKNHTCMLIKITYLSFIWCCGIFFFYLLGSLQELCGISWNCYLHLRALKHASISRLGIPLVTG